MASFRNRPAPSAWQKSFVVRGDKVLVSVDQAGSSCAWHFERFHEEVGWLPTERLKLEPVKMPAPQAWIGTWAPIQGGATIQIRRRNGVFESWGSTRWYGARVAMYGGEHVVHVGSFNGQGVIDKDAMTLSDNACIVKMQLVASDLVVTDNAACGGVNVSFGGVYKKLRK